MKRIVIALTASALASCVAGPDTSQPTVLIDPDRPQKVLPASGWTQAEAPLELAPPREIVIEQGFPHELPEAPRLLTVQATQPWTSGRALAMHDGQLFAVDQDNGMLVVSDAQSGRILRHIELGAMPEDVVVSAEGVAYVSVRGTGEVGGAVFASTLTTVAVFFPIVFVEGVAGQVFGNMALTVVFSLLASLGVALFFIPMLASRRIQFGRSPEKASTEADHGGIRDACTDTVHGTDTRTSTRARAQPRRLARGAP